MRADADLFLAYEYGCTIGMPASDVVALPVDELRGFVAYRKLKVELINGD